jgi:hypothetical protein
MYAAFWRILPGPVWLRIIIVLILVAAILYALVTWVFPLVDSMVTGNEEGTVAT